MVIAASMNRIPANVGDSGVVRRNDLNEKVIDNELAVKGRDRVRLKQKRQRA
jgi:hypothetical protein